MKDYDQSKMQFKQFPPPDTILALKHTDNIEERIELAHTLGIDTRAAAARLLDVGYIGYDMAIKYVVNSDNRELTALYLKPRSRYFQYFCIRPILQTIIFVGTASYSMIRLQEALENFDELQLLIDDTSKSIL